jgi:hypothetical protein
MNDVAREILGRIGRLFLGETDFRCESSSFCLNLSRVMFLLIDKILEDSCLLEVVFK